MPTLTLPTYITFLRIVMLWGLIVLHIMEPTWVGLSFFIFAFACITDFLDGFIARKYNMTSEFGAMLDQICDKILVIAVFVLLASRGTLAGWDILAATIIITREFLVAGLRDYYGNKGLKVPVSIWGKWKTTFQMIALTSFMMVPFMQFLMPYLHYFASATLWLAGIFGLLSAVGYVRVKSPLPSGEGARRAGEG